MAYAFDTLGYSQRLRAAGVEPEHADAMAEAARDFVMVELVTRTDLTAAVERLESKIDHLQLRLMVQMGGMLAAAIGALAIILKLT